MIDNAAANDKLDRLAWNYTFPRRVWRHLRMHTDIESRDVDDALMEMIGQMNEDVWEWRIPCS